VSACANIPDLAEGRAIVFGDNLAVLEPQAPALPAWERRAGGVTRLSLTERAPARIRGHARRDGVRIAVLLAADVAVLLLLGGLLGAGASPGNRVSPFQLVAAVVLGLVLFDCYGSGDRRRDPTGLTRAAGLGSVIGLWSGLWSGRLHAPFQALALLWLAIVAALIAERKLVDLLVRVVRPAEAQVLRAVVVGPTDQARRLIDHPAFADDLWCRLVAFLDPARTPGREATALARLIRERAIDTVILTGNLADPAFELTLDVAAASGCQVLSLPRVPPTATFLPTVRWRNGCPVVELTRPGLIGVQLLVKRLIDLLVSGAGLVLLAPLLGAIALAVRVSSRGPVLFRQGRIGQGGRAFTILKFRTMVAGAERQQQALAGRSIYGDGRLFKVADDPRVTPLGALLRRSSLDELPQLWNVFLGEMSLVGPRPPRPEEVALYHSHHYSRFDVKPGITGPWQVSGRNAINDFEKVIRLETAYIRQWSLWLDFELLCRTVPAVLSGLGAY
jgi:exopolysaccharide biosynthesis polyprenyl glycosylphosphotransferase